MTRKNLVIPIVSCSQYRLLLVVEISSVILIPCNSWMLLLRVKAFPTHFIPRFSWVLCSALWVTTFSSFLILLGFKVTDNQHIHDFCIPRIEYHKEVSAIPFITLLLFNSVTVSITSIGLIATLPALTWHERMRNLVKMEYMGCVSRIFLRSGQAYYG